MIVYLARAIQAFVMYYVNGTSRSSLLIESTDSMIMKIYAIIIIMQRIANSSMYPIEAVKTVTKKGAMCALND